MRLCELPRSPQRLRRSGGTSVAPGVADLLCVNPIPVTVRRVVVTNTITHPNLAELTGSLMHDRAAVVLDRHSPAGPAFPPSPSSTREKRRSERST